MNGTPVSTRQLSKGDIVAILIIGEVFSWLLIVLRKSLAIRVPDFAVWMLPVAMPLVALFCLWVFAVLGRKRPTLFQVGKYAAVGFVNTAVDFVIINILILWTGVVEGLGLGLLNSASFAIAVTNSYLWNKYWTFVETKKDGASRVEFAQFFTVSLVSLLINSVFVGTTTKYIAPPFGITPEQWVNLVKALGVFIALATNFTGYKLLVFREKRIRPTTADSHPDAPSP